ncbi:unnamed protein product [Wickerhamomyces anomalus]
MATAAFPELDPTKESILVENLLQWSLANGLVIYPPDFKSYQPVSAPVTLFPTPFPKVAFNDADDVQLLFNELYAKVSSDLEFLSEIIDDLAKFDTGFTGKLWEIFLKAKKIGISQPLSLVFHLGGLSTKVGELHRYLNNHGDYDIGEGTDKYYDEKDLPISESITKLSEGLADGNYYYNDCVSNTKTVVLVVVQHKERNVFDQRLLEYALLANHGVKSIRLTLSEIDSKTYIDPQTKKLYIKSTNDEVSVVYFRSGYAPNDFQNEQDWENRLTLETSKAIKAPTLLTQLVGAKKIQQILTDEVILKTFLKEKGESKFSTIIRYICFNLSIR